MKGIMLGCRALHASPLSHKRILLATSSRPLTAAAARQRVLCFGDRHNKGVKQSWGAEERHIGARLLQRSHYRSSRGVLRGISDIVARRNAAMNMSVSCGNHVGALRVHHLAARWRESGAISVAKAGLNAGEHVAGVATTGASVSACATLVLGVARRVSRVVGMAYGRAGVSNVACNRHGAAGMSYRRITRGAYVAWAGREEWRGGALAWRGGLGWPSMP